MFQLKPLIASLLAASCAITSTLTQAQLVNGSLTGDITNAGTPPGWTTTSESPDTIDAAHNVGVPTGLPYSVPFGAIPNASPDGGTWVGMGSDIDFIESFSQTLNGLTLGGTYSVSWFAGNFGAAGPYGYVQPNAINVLINGLSIGAGSTHSIGSDWYAESASFIAGATSQTLSFQLATSAKSYMSIDGIAVTAVSAVPEPETYAMLLAGLGLIGAVARRRNAKPA